MNTAVLHDPVSGASERVTLSWSTQFQGTFRITNPSGEAHDIALGDLTLARGGWRGAAITFTWEQEGRTWALTVDDPQTIAGLVRDLPPELSTQIATWQKQSVRGEHWSRALFTIGILITFIPLLLLIVLFLMRDRLVDLIVSRIPTSVDAAIGERMHQQLLASGTLVKDGPAVEALSAVSARVAPHLPGNDFKFRFEVVNDSSVNAFAAPGGLVVVNTGLLAKATSVDQLAGVLGHEVVHVTRRHSLRQILYSMGLMTTIQWAFGIPEGASVTIVGAAADLTALKFGRDQESEADAEGIELLQKAQLPASGLPSLFDILAEEKINVPAFLSTHPADAQRKASLERLIAERGTQPVEPLVIDWNAVRLDAENRLKNRGRQ